MHHYAIPYDMSHFPVSPLDLEFLLTGLDGLSGDERLDDDQPTNEALLKDDQKEGDGQ